jgi:hypothetical protein
MSHPSSIDLEAFACGEPHDAVADHLATCEACGVYVARLRDVVAAGPSEDVARDRVAAVESATPVADPDRARDDDGKAAPRPGARVRAILRASTIAAPMALAAMIFLLVRSGAPPADPPVAAPVPSPAAAPPAALEPPSEVAFKGGVQIAVIRERDGQQARFTSVVPVRPGDRLRLEVALDREQAILGGVLGEDGAYLELMPDSVRGAGTHLSERSARVDSTPTRGAVVVGVPEAVNEARTTRRLDGVRTLTIAWESAP